MDWTRLLDPANGGPGEAPGYQEVLAALQAKPYAPPKERKARVSQVRDTRKPRFPGLKHSQQP